MIILSSSPSQIKINFAGCRLIGLICFSRSRAWWPSGNDAVAVAVAVAAVVVVFVVGFSETSGGKDCFIILASIINHAITLLFIFIMDVVVLFTCGVAEFCKRWR